MVLPEFISKLLFCHPLKLCLFALFHSSYRYTEKVNYISPPHLFPFYPSEVSEPSKINVLGIGKVSENRVYLSEKKLYLSEILAQMTYILE